MRASPNLVAVPDSLAAITHIDHEREQTPEPAGVSADGLAAIWNAAEQLYRTGTHPMLSISLRRRGRVLLSRSIGHARGAEPDARGAALLPATPDTPVCLFSSSKAITALLVLKAAELGLLKLDDPIARHIPAYAQQGKNDTTIRQLLAHRAHIPSVPLHTVDYRLIYDWDGIIDLLCRTKPFRSAGEQQAYHAVTGGYILGELVRRASGLSLQDALSQWLAEPLGCKHLSYGLAPEHRASAALNVHTGPRIPWLADRACEYVIGIGFREVVRVSNEDDFLTHPVPAGNIFATADDAGRVFQMLLDNGVFEGRRVMEPQTVRAARIPFDKHRQIDRSLMLPIRFSAGMMLGDWPLGLYGLDCREAFGHLGFLSILCWADPARDISVAILNNGKTISPTAHLQLAKLIGTISRVCPRDHD